MPAYEMSDGARAGVLGARTVHLDQADGDYDHRSRSHSGLEMEPKKPSSLQKKKHKKKKPPLGVGIFGIFGFYSLPIRRAEFSDLIQAEA
jgi:hypothetical protein